MYLRHRPRLVQQSVVTDLQDTLIACRWMVGTTSRAVLNPVTGLVEVVTTGLDDVYPLAQDNQGAVLPITLQEYFPEDAGEITRLNTFAVDVLKPEDPEDLELGSNAEERMYVFNFAGFFTSDAMGISVMSDLGDRYAGRLLGNESIDLIDFVADPATVAARMEIDVFRWTLDINGIAPDAHLFFGELSIVDVVD